ncbi:MAG: terpene cyclase/mutase family protein, partial [Gemmataceae bacterium]|nr:terpene cyclase/mutase family protein [Gemmataceae bacterium]
APVPSLAQDEATDRAIKDKLATIRYVLSLRTPNGGFAPADGQKQPTLRATASAIRAVKYLTGKPVQECVPEADRVAGFVWGCYDPKTGGFADTFDGKPDVPSTAIGVAAAIELGIPKEKFAKAMTFLRENAKTFEEVRIAASAVEVWGPKDSPIDTKPWQKVVGEYAATFAEKAGPEDAREVGSVAAFWLRLGEPLGAPEVAIARKSLLGGQRADGGWGRKGEAASDVDTTYRVMRALYLLKEKPKDPAGLRKFVAARRNGDGGYGLKPGEASSAAGVYYAAILSKWLNELEK